MCRIVRFLRGGEKGRRSLLLPQSGSHVGVSGPNFVGDLIAKRIDLRLRRLFVGVGLRNTVLAARAVEEIPSQLEFGTPNLALCVASGKKILLPVRACQPTIPLEAQRRKILGSRPFERSVCRAQARQLLQQVRSLAEGPIHLLIDRVSDG